eukprot:GHVU01041212.1.p1 GENE.GHVU01041212.1~~GHVU01041212.1.p1  ORF type:complete len:219 (+),score=22.45 GHVU01041212.1:1653-2309(+)
MKKYMSMQSCQCRLIDEYLISKELPGNDEANRTIGISILRDWNMLMRSHQMLDDPIAAVQGIGWLMKAFGALNLLRCRTHPCAVGLMHLQEVGQSLCKDFGIPKNNVGIRGPKGAKLDRIVGDGEDIMVEQVRDHHARFIVQPQIMCFISAWLHSVMTTVLPPTAFIFDAAEAMAVRNDMGGWIPGDAVRLLHDPLYTLYAFELGAAHARGSYYQTQV